MAAQVLAQFFYQTGIPALAPFEWAANIAGVAVFLVNLVTYIKTKDASVFKSQNAWTIYLLAAISSVMPINIDVYAQALGAFGTLFANLVAVAVKLAGTVVLQPYLLTAIVALSVDYLLNMQEMYKKGQLFKKYATFD